MRQNDGSEILGSGDPRNVAIGIIHVTASDERQGVLTAITTQEKLGRDQIILDLPMQNKAFKASVDFEGLRQMSRDIEAGLVLIVPAKSKIESYASKQGFTFYHSLDELVAAEFPPMQPDAVATPAPAPMPASPPADFDESDHTQLFQIVPPVAPAPPDAAPPDSATTPTAYLPVPADAQAAPAVKLPAVTPLPATPEAEEPPTQEIPAPVTPMSEAEEPPTQEIPAPVPTTPKVEEPSVQQPATATPPSAVAPVVVTPLPPSSIDDEDETPTDPSLVAASAPPSPQNAPGTSGWPADAQSQRSSYLPAVVPGSGSALVTTNAQPPMYYAPSEPSRRPPWRGLLLTALIVLIVLGLLFLFNRPILDLLFPPGATVTIAPANQRLKHTYQITAVLGVPDPSKNQVDARALYSTSQTQSKTVPATGQGRTPGQQAQGQLTFYDASTNPQTVPAGTVIFDNDGLAVVNNAGINLPGLDPSQPLVGVNTSARTVNDGAGQNIPANDFHNTLCCGGTIYVTNSAAFSGGQDPQPFTYVQQSDIDTVTQSLETTLAPIAVQGLQAQVRSNEKMAGTPRCAPVVTSNHRAGELASNVTVRVTTTCLGEVYDAQAVQTLAAHNLMQDATQNPGSAYAPVGQIVSNVMQAAPDSHGNIILVVDTQGVWVYQFTNALRTHLANLIAGKNESDARTILLGQPGVGNVAFVLTGVAVTNLPTDASHITIDVSAVAGLHP